MVWEGGLFVGKQIQSVNHFFAKKFAAFFGLLSESNGAASFHVCVLVGWKQFYSEFGFSIFPLP